MGFNFKCGATVVLLRVKVTVSGLSVNGVECHISYVSVNESRYPTKIE
jgi:hypothetical protein